MKKIMVVGERGSGKNALVGALSGHPRKPHADMALEYAGQYINAPAEFLENRRFYPALITASMECAVLLMLQSAAARTCLYPPGFASMFNRKVLGLITYTRGEEIDPRTAERFLRFAGVRDILSVNLADTASLDALRLLLAGHTGTMNT